MSCRQAVQRHAAGWLSSPDNLLTGMLAELPRVSPELMGMLGVKQAVEGKSCGQPFALLVLGFTIGTGGATSVPSLSQATQPSSAVASSDQQAGNAALC